jgi:hypothetical protein
MTVIVFAKTEQCAADLCEQFRDRHVGISPTLLLLLLCLPPKCLTYRFFVPYELDK